MKKQIIEADKLTFIKLNVGSQPTVLEFTGLAHSILEDIYIEGNVDSVNAWPSTVKKLTLFEKQSLFPFLLNTLNTMLILLNFLCRSLSVRGVSRPISKLYSQNSFTDNASIFNTALKITCLTCLGRGKRGIFGFIWCPVPLFSKIHLICDDNMLIYLSKDMDIFFSTASILLIFLVLFHRNVF